MLRFKALFRPIYAPIVRRARWRAATLAERRRIRSEVERARRQGQPIRIILGAGDRAQAGWIATDIPAFDACDAGHWRALFPPRSIQRLLAEHVFEHLTAEQFCDFLTIASDYLTPDGRIRIAVPDGNHPDAAYIERVRPGGTGIGADDHKILYTRRLASELMGRCGYDAVFLESFDEAGRFQQRAWSAIDGYISRSAENDRRNTDGELNYTSLIFDCWPAPLSAARSSH